MFRIRSTYGMEGELKRTKRDICTFEGKGMERK